jgi:hypothetical protein
MQNRLKQLLSLVLLPIPPLSHPLLSINECLSRRVTDQVTELPYARSAYLVLI